MFGRAGLVRFVGLFGLGAFGCGHGGAPPPPTAVPAGTAPASRVAAAPADGTSAVKAALAAVGAGEAAPTGLATPVVIGTALWALLVKLDPALSAAGTPTANALPHQTGPKQTVEVRSFVHEPERAALLQSPGFRKIGRAFGQAKIRAATDDERKLFYLLVPFEIVGHAVTIAERDADRLVVFLDDEGRPAWLDVLSAYAAGGP